MKKNTEVPLPPEEIIFEELFADGLEELDYSYFMVEEAYRFREYRKGRTNYSELNREFHNTTYREKFELLIEQYVEACIFYKLEDQDFNVAVHEMSIIIKSVVKNDFEIQNILKRDAAIIIEAIKAKPELMKEIPANLLELLKLLNEG